MKSKKKPKFRIYPSIGIARVGNGKAEKDEVIFSPEVPWANLFETDQNYLTKEGAIKKQAQRFYIYACDKNGAPVAKINPAEYKIEWTVEVANKKPFWYDFNNSLDLSIKTKNYNLSSNFYKEQIAPGISAALRNPNVLNEGLRKEGTPNYREELVNSPNAVTVKERQKKTIDGQFPFPLKKSDGSLLAQKMSTTSKPVTLATVENDKGTLIFYPADGISAALNPSDLNTDFADNSNWYDDICDGRVTARITHKKTGKVFDLSDADAAAWVATAPPDYAPQIQPIATMYDLISGIEKEKYTPEMSLVFPLFYRLYRMQWVNAGDFLSPSFRETIDELTANGKFQLLFKKEPGAKAERERIFNLFRNPKYDYNNEPIIPSKDTTDLTNFGSGTETLKLPFYPGDGINYPGSPAQWFAVPPILYQQLKNWKDGKFETPEDFDFEHIDEMGAYYQRQFEEAAKDDSKSALLMTRAVLETLYGGGFHPGVELTWPMRHSQIYAENTEVYKNVHKSTGLFGLREIRINAASPEEQAEIFYNDFGLLMTPDHIQKSISPRSKNHWIWKITPGDLTKWMGIPWQSDAGSCQAVFTDSQYPVPAWWAANLPVDVLTKDSLDRIQDEKVLPDTKQYIYGNRLPWLQTTDTGFVGYHAEAGYLNGLINMVYKWKNIGMVTGRKSETDVNGIPEIVYVSLNGKQEE